MEATQRVLLSAGVPFAKSVFQQRTIRHYVVEPLFLAGTFITNYPAVSARYCATDDAGAVQDYSDIDRQTELNDDDGTLTG